MFTLPIIVKECHNRPEWTGKHDRKKKLNDDLYSPQMVAEQQRKITTKS